MDPTVCLRNMLDANADGDPEAAKEYATSLYTWLMAGGFTPGINGELTSNEQRELIMIAVRSLACLKTGGQR